MNRSLLIFCFHRPLWTTRDPCLNSQEPGFHIIPCFMEILGKFLVSEYYCFAVTFVCLCFMAVIRLGCVVNFCLEQIAATELSEETVPKLLGIANLLKVRFLFSSETVRDL